MSKCWEDGKRTPEYRDSLIHQTNLWMQGISVHNQFSDECCPDFSCCRSDTYTAPELRRAIGEKMLLEFAE